jgi:hypothetical protein
LAPREDVPVEPLSAVGKPARAAISSDKLTRSAFPRQQRRRIPANDLAQPPARATIAARGIGRARSFGRIAIVGLSERPLDRIQIGRIVS